MGSVLVQTSSWPALHEYFGKGFLIAESNNWTQFAQLFSNPDMVRGATQRTFTAPFYGGNAYSLAAMIGRRNLSLQVALRRLRHEHWQSNAESLAPKEENRIEAPELSDAPLQDFENEEKSARAL